MFMIATTAGVVAFRGTKGTGMPEDQAKASAADRNERAVELGVEARYEVVPFVAAPKE